MPKALINLTLLRYQNNYELTNNQITSSINLDFQKGICPPSYKHAVRIFEVQQLLKLAPLDLRSSIHKRSVITPNKIVFAFTRKKSRNFPSASFAQGLFLNKYSKMSCIDPLVNLAHRKLFEENIDTLLLPCSDKIKVAVSSPNGSQRIECT